MRSWSRLWRKATQSSPTKTNQWVRLTLPGWNEDNPADDLRIWRDSSGDVLSLAVPTPGIRIPYEAGETELRRWARDIAQTRDAGLIEAHGVPCGLGPAVILIFKRLQLPAYIYTGMLFTSIKGVSLVWTIVAGEHGTTGVREAVVTANLMNEGKLTVDGYTHSWADPYDPSYRGVRKAVLRFISDDESYDQQFPWHPLSRVRRLLAVLPDNMRFDSPTF